MHTTDKIKVCFSALWSHRDYFKKNKKQTLTKKPQRNAPPPQINKD